MRRIPELLRLVSPAAVALAFSATTAFAAAPAKRPNILVVFCDDHAYQAISAYGEERKLVDTPNIDRIAKEGVRFDRCLVTNSICGPSRATLLTSKYSHLNGFYNNNNSRFDSSQTTFPKLLKASGYQTAVVGKWHLVTDPVGFDFWQILPGQGAYYNPTMIKNGERLRVPGYTTDIITDLSIDWLKNRDKSKPFLLMTQHKAPHRDWQPPLRHLDHDKGRRYAEPKTLFDDYSGRGKAVADQDMTIADTMTPNDLKLTRPADLDEAQLKVWNEYYVPRNKAFQEANLKGADLVRWKYQRYMHDYLGCVKAVDDGVGRLLDELDKQGLAEDTIVVYSSDQGFFLGEHGWFDKRWIFEESLRSPLLIRWPGVAKAGSVNRDLVSILDIGETALDAAGVSIPAEMQGRSLRPLIAGSTPADWRKSFYYEYYEYPAPHHVRPHYGVITDRYKLVRFPLPDVDYWELYDRSTDPDELHDVSKRPENAKVVDELKTELARLRKDLKVPDQPPKEAYGGLYAAPKAATKKAAAPKKKAVNP